MTMPPGGIGNFVTMPFARAAEFEARPPPTCNEGHVVPYQLYRRALDARMGRAGWTPGLVMDDLAINCLSCRAALVTGDPVFAEWMHTAVFDHMDDDGSLAPSTPSAADRS